jgi:hypothetical protein
VALLAPGQRDNYLAPMPRWFNTAGPCDPAKHYMLPALRRLPQVRPLIEQEGYFILHAPRQVGKTTALRSLARELTAEGRYTAALVSMEPGEPFPKDVGAAEAAVLSGWRLAMRAQLPPELQLPPFPDVAPGGRIGTALATWAESSPRPVVVFLDEIDALRDEALQSVLRQLRAGYPQHPTHFPHALALIGLRDIQDYKVASNEEGRLGTPSPFNIMVRSLTLRNFTREEVAELYQQHTQDTGQRFELEALALAFELTQGQPWLVNALAKVAVEELVPDSTRPVRREDIERAKNILIDRQETHLGSLAARLREPRVRAIVEPLLAGLTLGDVPEDDVRFVQDLGLLRIAPTGGLEVANPIYRQIIPRMLASTPMASLPHIPTTWLDARGRLDTERLMEAFMAFWRQHGEPLMGSAPYAEVAPHLVVLAFLQRVANGGGTLERDYAIGTGRMDICLRYGPDTLALELKVWRKGRVDPLKEGLEQLDKYLSGLGLESGWLIIFDQRKGRKPVAERTRAKAATTPSGRQVTVLRA